MGGGKTAALINEGQQLNLDYAGNYGLLMRKTWPSFRDTVMPQMERFIHKSLIVKWNLTEKVITYVNGSRIRYGGIGDDPNDWEKFMSGEYGWIALDQAEDFSHKEFKMLATRLRLNLPGLRRFFLLSCNPTLGWIKELFLERPKDDYVFIPALPHDNLENLPEDYEEKMRDVLDENLIKALLEGDWEAVGDGSNVFAYQKVKEAMDRAEGRGEPVEIGVDVARSGEDWTVLAVRFGVKVRFFSKNLGHDTMRTAGEIWRCVRWLRCDLKILEVNIKIDCDGLGAGVFDRVREQRILKEKELKMKIKMVEIHGNAAAEEKTKFKNARAEMHWALREMMGFLDLPNQRELLSQLMAIKYMINSAGQIQVEDKREIKKRLGKSPDEAEAIIYTWGQSATSAKAKIWISTQDAY